MSNDTNTFNPDHNWDFNFNLSGISAPLGGKSVEIPEGYYKATIVDAYVNAEQNANRVVFKLSLQGEFAGIIRTDGLNKPKDPQDKVRYYWRALAESAGYTPAQLDSGEIKLGLSAFKDKTVHIKYTPKKGDAMENISYLPPAVWTQRAAATTTGSKDVTMPASDAGTKTKADMLEALNLS